MSEGTTNSRGLILAYGELLWDVLPSGPVLGGAPANFAYRLQSFGHRAIPVSRLGRDEYGDKAIAQLASNEVDTSLIQRDPEYPTGTVDVTLSAAGDASYTINTGVAYDHIECAAALAEAATQCSVLYFGSLIQRHPDSRNTLYRLIELAPQAIKLLDLNLRRDCFDRSTVEESLRRCDILKLNDDEARVVANMLGIEARTFRAFCESIIARFDIDTCIVTRGQFGSYALSRDQQEARSQGYEVVVADTVGSGDSFTAGFIHSRLEGRPLQDCCDFGNRIGALVAERRGGMCVVTENDISHFARAPRVERSAELHP